MTFENVELTAEEQEYWVNYFIKMYPEKNGYVGNRTRWEALTINDEKTIFVKKVDTERDDWTASNFLYFWHGHLFRLKMRVTWGEEDIESWEIMKLDDYYSGLRPGIYFSDELSGMQDKILSDLKGALITYGKAGFPIMKGYEEMSAPMPNIKLIADGRIY